MSAVTLKKKNNQEVNIKKQKNKAIKCNLNNTYYEQFRTK